LQNILPVFDGYVSPATTASRAKCGLIHRLEAAIIPATILSMPISSNSTSDSKVQYPITIISV
jgi:hypothetical protein